jgi:hypothetical protein
MTLPQPERPEPGPDADIDDIQADIEKTRDELGETVQAISGKLDVKAQAHQKVEDTKERVAERVDTIKHAATDNPKRTVPVAAVVAVVAVAAGILIWRRRH